VVDAVTVTDARAATGQMTDEQKIRALAEALARLTHHPQNNSHPCIAKDCAMHPDAAVHHTPARVLGLPPNEGGTPPIGEHNDDAIDDAATLIATSVNAAFKQRHGGWGQYTPAAQAAVLDLLAAGWTPPGADTPDTRLRDLVAEQQAQIDRLSEQNHRQYAQTVAAEAYREKAFQVWVQLQKGLLGRAGDAKAAGEPEPTYTGEQVLKWLRTALDRGSSASERAEVRAKAEWRPRDGRLVATVPVQEALL
jgi:hypothetical protein